MHDLEETTSEWRNTHGIKVIACLHAWELLAQLVCIPRERRIQKTQILVFYYGMIPLKQHLAWRLHKDLSEIKTVCIEVDNTINK